MKLANRILLGLGASASTWRNQLKELERRHIIKIALFLECMRLAERRQVYRALLKSHIKQIPLVHIRGDMNKKELVFLSKNFHSIYFTIHEKDFRLLSKWSGYHKNLFLEMNTDNFVSRSVQVKKIGGFCVDLSHFKVEEEKWSKEFEYITRRKKVTKDFACNHLNGYSYKLNSDVHVLHRLNEFNYLKTLPSFVFGKAIALEAGNSIAQQLKFKKYVCKLMSR